MKIKDYLPYLTIIGSVLAFVLTVFQYLDTRMKEDETKRFEQYHRVFEWVAGRTAEGKVLVNTQQAMAIYELSHFPEYKELSLPIIEYYIEASTGEPDDSLRRSALLYTKGKLTAQ